MSDDNRDYWAAFAIGAIVGVGATLLLSSAPRRKRRLPRLRLRKPRKLLRRRI